MNCRFSCKISGIELRDGGVEIFEVEHDDRRDLIFVDLDDAEHIGEESPGPCVVARDPREEEAPPAGCDDVGREVCDPDSAVARMFAISASRPCRDPRVYGPTAIVD